MICHAKTSDCGPSMGKAHVQVAIEADPLLLEYLGDEARERRFWRTFVFLWSMIAFFVIMGSLTAKLSSGADLAPVPVTRNRPAPLTSRPELASIPATAPRAPGRQLLARSFWQWTAPAPHHAAVVQITCAGAGTTGVLMEHAGLRCVLTCAHGLGGAATATVEFSDGTRRQGRYETAGGHDIGIIFVDHPGITPAPLAVKYPQVGDLVELCGFGGPLEKMRTFVCRVIGTGGETHTDGPVMNGDSGAPLFNTEGEVVGVNTAGLARDPSSPSYTIGHYVASDGHPWPIYETSTGEAFPLISQFVHRVGRQIGRITQGVCPSCPGGSYGGGGYGGGYEPSGGGGYGGVGNPQIVPPDYRDYDGQAPAPQAPAPDPPRGPQDQPGGVRLTPWLRKSDLDLFAEEIKRRADEREQKIRADVRGEVEQAVADAQAKVETEAAQLRQQIQDGRAELEAKTAQAAARAAELANQAESRAAAIAAQVEAEVASQTSQAQEQAQRARAEIDAALARAPTTEQITHSVTEKVTAIVNEKAAPPVWLVSLVGAAGITGPAGLLVAAGVWFGVRRLRADIDLERRFGGGAFRPFR